MWTNNDSYLSKTNKDGYNEKSAQDKIVAVINQVRESVDRSSKKAAKANPAIVEFALIFLVTPLLAAIITLLSSINPSATNKASSSPVSLQASFKRSTYFFLSLKFKGSTITLFRDILLIFQIIHKKRLPRDTLHWKININ